MQIRDVMSTPPRTVGPTASVHEVATMMEDANCGFIPVVDESGPVGVVTDRDLVIRCLSSHAPVTGPAAGDTAVAMVMSPQVFTIGPGRTLEEAAHMMAEHRVRRLPIVDDGEVVGVLSLGCLEQALHGEGEAAREVLLGVTEGA